MAAALSITDAFDDYGSMEALLRRLGISARCTTRFMDEEGFETARDLASPVRQMLSPQLTM